ncbi:hypothetical protein C1H46_017748 [Malus baccata]|uniref:Terpene synthase metal-binding domain-containing protein n=1 Tax=Malus baccata TaxID=106549 RepID=A0A540MCV3_MALBA|nr:hypothetical protein C1H46_017748 [Malus baccata]
MRLLTFAKLDFNLLQKVHQKELSEISRDRVVECYLWGLGCCFEPEYSFARMIFGKVTAIVVLIDDIYDVYGTLEELELFTEAVERWNISAMFHLREYMKVCYQALLDLYVEIEETLENEGNSYRIRYAREAFEQKRGHVASSVECYMKEYDATEEQATIELTKQVNNEWKDVNEVCLRPTIFPMQLMLRIVNLARMIEVIYKHDDGFTQTGIYLKDIVVSFFVEPVPV